jgi:hypothetical protein
MGSTRSAKAYYQQFSRKKYTPRTWHSMYYQNGIYTVQRWLLPAACATREKYNPGTWHSSMYISEWDSHGSAATTTSSANKGEI